MGETASAVRDREAERTVTGRSRADLLLGGLLLVHLALKLALFPRAARTPLVGDEGRYVEGARALAAMVHPQAPFLVVDHALVAREVVGYGWFMPGLSLLLTPLYLVHPGAGLEGTRVYLGIVSLLMLVATALLVRRVLGPPYAVALLVVPGLLPMWVLFSYSALGDLPAGLLVAVLVTMLVQVGRTLRRGAAPGPWTGMGMGLVAIAAVYARPTAFPLVLGLLVLLAVGIALLLPRGRWGQGALSWGLAVVVVAGLLLPWSVTASQALGSRVVTTTSVPISLAVAFGDPEELCFGRCPPGNLWIRSVEYSRRLAEQQGVSQLVVQKEMSRRALEGVTPHSYAVDVLGDLGRYLLRPAGFEAKFRPPDAGGDRTSRFVTVGTEVGYLLGLLVAVGALLRVVRGPVDQQVTSLLLKLVAAALLLQPFVHICSSRYWPVFAPLFALLAGLTWQRGRGAAPAGGEPGSVGLSTALTRVQGVVVAGFVLVAVALVVLAA